MTDEEGPVPPIGDDKNADPAEETEKVGYKCPPKKHRFKKGQKPPPRKRKPTAKSQSPRKLLTRLLAEARPARVNGKVVWLSTGDLVVRKAFEVAERSPKIRRLLTDLQFQADSAEEPQNIMILDPLDGCPPTIIRGEDYPNLAREYAALAKELPDGWAGGTISLRICPDAGDTGD